jgi:hypothetical protein
MGFFERDNGVLECIRKRSWFTCVTERLLVFFFQKDSAPCKNGFGSISCYRLTLKAFAVSRTLLWLNSREVVT